MSHPVRQAKQVLGQRLRELRKTAGLSGRELAHRAGWHPSKVSKVEYGKQAPSRDDIRVWCTHTNTQAHISDLLDAVRNLDSLYIEWRRYLRTGTHQKQEEHAELEAQTSVFRWYEPVLIAGILHTEGYARAVLERVIAFYDIPDDLNKGVRARLVRQQRVLRRAKHRFHILLAEQALYTRVGDEDVMVEQLRHLTEVTRWPQISLGIIPRTAAYSVPTNQFIIFDERLVKVEGISAELSITQPTEIALYSAAFNTLHRYAAYGPAARLLITGALSHVSS